MAWWTAALLEAAPFVYSGISGMFQGNTQSRLDSETALANSIATNQAYSNNAKSIMALGRFNSALELQGAKAEGMRTRALTDFNVEQTLFLGDYNGTLLENEALLVLEAADIDLAQMKREHDRAIGETLVSHGASGAMMDQGTPGAVVQDMRWQQEQERFIVRRGADVQYGKLMAEAAMSRYRAGMDAGRIQLEGRLMEASTYTNAGLSALGISAQSGIDASITRYNGSVEAAQILNRGMLASDSSSRSASSSFWSGMFAAGTSLGSSYIRNKSSQNAMSQLTSLLGA